MDLIKERREEIRKDPKVAEQGDFLTLMITNEFFKGNDITILDECLTFMVAATQTMSVLISNTLFYVTRHPELAQKVREESMSVFKVKNYHELTSD